MNSNFSCPVTGKPCVKHKGYFVTEKKGEEVRSYSVCEDCMHLNRSLKVESEIDHCPNCRSTLDEIVKTSRLGCATCYEHFEKPLAFIVASVQAGASAHTGEPPDSYKRGIAESTKGVSFATEIMTKMKIAARDGRYEEAASLKAILSSVKDVLSRSNEKGELGPEDKSELAEIIYRYRYPGSL